MAIAERTTETTWEGSLGGGRGSIRPATGAFDALPVTWASRTEHRDAETSPEELAAAAYSACFAMALARHLGDHQVVPGRLTAAAIVTPDEAGGGYRRSSRPRCGCAARCPGSTRPAFRRWSVRRRVCARCPGCSPAPR